MKGIIICCFLVLIPSFTQGLLKTYEYEFGKNVGVVIYDYTGKIPLTQHTTQKSIPVPNNAILTYVKVTVDAIAPPKVDFNRDTNVVTVKFSWAKIYRSTYTVQAKGLIY
ncbi:uncharacterized protein LOC116773145 [Danaus plexippus]|uniref:uncharacterized protein LOC116773145 n=1 Tax=Danaus plexippus TaxID=13037 RepID=UPI002AAF2D5D|nr:uncharacterized protein LOC116773145 [Danaus plexippus]